MIVQVTIFFLASFFTVAFASAETLSERAFSEEEVESLVSDGLMFRSLPVGRNRTYLCNDSVGSKPAGEYKIRHGDELFSIKFIRDPKLSGIVVNYDPNTGNTNVVGNGEIPSSDKEEQELIELFWINLFHLSPFTSGARFKLGGIKQATVNIFSHSYNMIGKSLEYDYINGMNVVVSDVSVSSSGEFIVLGKKQRVKIQGGGSLYHHIATGVTVKGRQKYKVTVNGVTSFQSSKIDCSMVPN
jgi:hypothetical protein